LIYILLTIIGYWIATGTVVAMLMVSGLYFARGCEWLVDSLLRKNKNIHELR